MFTCPKCLGSGYIEHFNHVQSGVCFRCAGTGLVDILDTEYEDDVCDDILSLIKRIPNGVCFVQIYVWNKHLNKKSYGTGHSYGHIIEGTQVRSCYDTELHVSLEECRNIYRSCIAEGYELIPDNKHREVFDNEVLPHRINCGMSE